MVLRHFFNTTCYCMPLGLISKIKILLLPATEVEEDAVLHYLKPPDKTGEIIKTFIDERRIGLHIGKYGGKLVIVGNTAPSKSRQGPVHAAIVLTKILMSIKHFEYIVSVGACYELKGQKLGDVVVSDVIADGVCRREGIEPSQSFPQGPQTRVDVKILNLFPSEKKLNLPCDPKYEIEVKRGDYICAPILVDNPEVKESLRSDRRNAAAGEMEGAGIMAVTEYFPMVSAIVIKSISDRADGSKNKDTSKNWNWRDFAACTSAYYVKLMLNDATLL